MQHALFPQDAEQQSTYPIAILVKDTAFKQTEMYVNYVYPLKELGIEETSLIAFSLATNDAGKTPAGFVKEKLASLLKTLEHLQVKYLYVTDATYFNVLAGKTSAQAHFGYVLPCKVKGYEHMQVVLGLNYAQLFYNPTLEPKLHMSLKTLATVVGGTYEAIGTDVIHSMHVPTSLQEAAQALESLLQYPSLSCDIEAFSLRFNEAGIGTIAFAWDEHNGIAIPCDFVPYENPVDGLYGEQQSNSKMKELLKEFFTKYQGELIFHNAAYDVKVIIANLWMKDLLDTESLLTGLEIMTRKLHDTKIIAYLATNSCAGNKLSLKDLAHEFAGNWALEVTDIRKHPLDKLLQYNLVDCLSTWYVYKKYVPIMESDLQGDLYRGLFLDSLKLIIQLELTGMPMSKSRIQEVKQELLEIQQQQIDLMLNSPITEPLNKLLRHDRWLKDYEGRRDKAKNPDRIKPKEISAFDNVVFNPNSGPQMQKLLYELMQLPVIDYTESKAPATGADTLEKLINHTNDEFYKEYIGALIAHGKVTKILSTFIPAFEAAISKDDSDTVWLHGSFNLGGTVSGRLSSSEPNLQNLPANSVYGKLIKSCFIASEGWLFCGADFNSLEDYISALTTKDPNKLAVYLRGYDGHCLRAAYYFRDQLPSIDLDDPDSVNTIKKLRPDLRQDSKGPTFALTYQGTWHTLVNNLGWEPEMAKQVEASYHEMYKASDVYVQEKLKQASSDGYVTVAFGLRVRTPLLSQVIYGSPKMPYEAAAEGRTAGNALGQSYGLLNNRAAVAFFKKVWNSPYRTKIVPVALIHDAIYVVIKDDVDVVKWANDNLIKEMQWQELPEIQHDQVKLGANLDIYWPSWANDITLPNQASQQEIIDLCNEAKKD